MKEDVKMVQMLLEKPADGSDNFSFSMDSPKFPADANGLEDVSFTSRNSCKIRSSE